MESTNHESLVREIAAVLIASGRALSVRALAAACHRPTEDIAEAVGLLKQKAGELGLKIVDFAGGSVKVLVDGAYRRAIHAIKPEGIPTRGKLSPEAAETLALLQEKGPMTIAEIRAWRGCNARNVIATLTAWGLVAPAGRAKGRGGPIRYGAVRPSVEEVHVDPPAGVHEEAQDGLLDLDAAAASPQTSSISERPMRRRPVRRRRSGIFGEGDPFHLYPDPAPEEDETRAFIIPFPPPPNRRTRDPDEKQFIAWVAEHHAHLVTDTAEARRTHGLGLIAVAICDDPTIVDTTPQFLDMKTLMGIGDWDSMEALDAVAMLPGALVVVGVAPYVVFRIVARPGERRCSLTRTTGPLVNRWVRWVTKREFDTVDASDVNRLHLPERFRQEYLDDFRKRFGRDPEPGDPICYDEDESVPTPISKEKGHAMLLDLFRSQGEPADRLYAYEQTGYWITEENKHRVSEEMLRAWNAAIREYHEFAGKKQ